MNIVKSLLHPGRNEHSSRVVRDSNRELGKSTTGGSTMSFQSPRFEIDRRAGPDSGRFEQYKSAGSDADKDVSLASGALGKGSVLQHEKNTKCLNPSFKNPDGEPGPASSTEHIRHPYDLQIYNEQNQGSRVDASAIEDPTVRMPGAYRTDSDYARSQRIFLSSLGEGASDKTSLGTQAVNVPDTEKSCQNSLQAVSGAEEPANLQHCHGRDIGLANAGACEAHKSAYQDSGSGKMHDSFRDSGIAGLCAATAWETDKKRHNGIDETLDQGPLPDRQDIFHGKGSTLAGAAGLAAYAAEKHRRDPTSSQAPLADKECKQTLKKVVEKKDKQNTRDVNGEKVATDKKNGFFSFLHRRKDWNDETMVSESVDDDNSRNRLRKGVSAASKARESTDKDVRNRASYKKLPATVRV